MQPPSQDPTNQSNQPEQPSSYLQPDQTMPPQPLPGNTFPQSYGQGEHPGEEAHYGVVSQSPAGNYPTPYYPNSHDKASQPKRSNAMTTVVLVLLALVIILGATTVLAWRHTNSSPIAVPLTPTQQTGAGQVTPTPTATSPVATNTPAPSSSATASTSAPVASGAITENLLLTCGTNCNDPIRVTITTIQVNDADGNMTWNISLKNVSGSSMDYGIDTFELLASGTQAQIPANFSQKSGTLPNSDPESIQGIFAFVPTQNTTYTLTVVIEENPFMGPQITFEPAQITNL